MRGLREFSTLTYDVRGHGKTSVGMAEGTLAQLGQDLIALLEAVTGPACCVGFSLGGTIVLQAAAARPELEPAVVAMATSSVVGSQAAEFYRQRIALVRSRDRDAIAQAVSDDVAAMSSNPGANAEAAVSARLRAIGDGSGYANAAEAMVRLNVEPLTPRLAAISQPTLVVGGESDRFCPRKAAEIMLAALPNATHVELPGVGHDFNLDAPAAVTGVIVGFLRPVHQR